jgi:hypothetical protein
MIAAAVAVVIHASLMRQEYHEPLTPVNYHAKRTALSPFSGMGGMDLLHCPEKIEICGMAWRYPEIRTLWAESSIMSIIGHTSGQADRGGGRHHG